MDHNIKIWETSLKISRKLPVLVVSEHSSRALWLTSVEVWNASFSSNFSGHVFSQYFPSTQKSISVESLTHSGHKSFAMFEKSYNDLGYIR